MAVGVAVGVAVAVAVAVGVVVGVAVVVMLIMAEADGCCASDAFSGSRWQALSMIPMQNRTMNRRRILVPPYCVMPKKCFLGTGEPIVPFFLKFFAAAPQKT